VPGFWLYVDIHFGTGVLCMVMSAPAVLRGAFWHVCICLFVFRYVYLCRVVCMPELFSFLFLLVGTPGWVVRVVEMPRRGCLQKISILKIIDKLCPLIFASVHFLYFGRIQEKI